MRIRHHIAALACLPLVILQGSATARAPLAARHPLQVSVDTTDAPDLAEWADNAKNLCIAWYPRISKLLSSPKYTPPDSCSLVFSSKYRGVAGTSGTRIQISAAYVRAHQDDFGMVVHELTHVVQGYPTYQAGWLVEGIADYIRFYHFEPKAPRPRINPDRATYHDAYRTSAAFLSWVEKKYDHRLVHKLNIALRSGNYSNALFEEYTRHNVDTLWSEFTDLLRAGKAGVAHE